MCGGEGTFYLLGFEDGVLFRGLGADEIGVVGVGYGDEGVYGGGI